MKIVAKHPVQLGGHIYSRGEAADYAGKITPRIAANFVRADGSALVAPAKAGDSQTQDDRLDTETKAGDSQTQTQDDKVDAETKAINATIRSLKKEGIARKLDELGVTYPADAKADFLARLLLMSQGEIKA